MKKVKLRIEPIGKEVEVIPGTPLKDVIFEYGVEFPCGGNGTCGGCKVKLISGDVKNPEKHIKIIRELGIDLDYRLACISEIVDDLTLEIPQFDSLILADNTEFTFESMEGHGIAIDIGSTTIVAQLVDLSTSKVLEVETARNPQIRFGTDIISRILHGLTNDGANQLKEIIRDECYNLVNLLIKDKVIDLKKIVLVGNSVMHHLFCGFDVKPLSQYPFETTNNQSIVYFPEDLQWNISSDCQIIFTRPIASFIGSDIFAGIIASEMDKNNDLTALIDLGTNGEIVIGNRDKMVCASTAAGPAFEGANIEMGMSAITGAISSVELSNSEVHYHVIGNTEARGICGSALIDAVSVFLKKGILDIGGEIHNEEKKLHISDKVYLTQKDVKEFQLAKAAIAACFQILLKKLGKSYKDVTKVYIAGGFGNFINLKNLIKLGILEIEENKIHKLGNSALIGAKMLLFTDDYSFTDIISKIEHVGLNADAGFQDIFVDKLFFTI